MTFICASSVWKKYVHWFYIMPILLYIIFSHLSTILKASICFQYKEFILFTISPFGNIFGLKLEIT